MRYVSYTRLNPWDEQEKVMTIGEQNRVIESYAKDRHWSIAKRYSDPKKREDGSGMRRLICDGMARQFDGVAVAAFPYFGAEPNAARRTAFEILYAAGISFAVAEDDFDSTRLSAKEVAGYFERKRRDMHARMAENWLEKSGNFMLHRCPPYGYKVSDDGLSYVKDAAAARYVEEIFKCGISGMKPAEIADRLNKNGVPNRSAYKEIQRGRVPTGNTLWNADKVAQILKNEIYSGGAVRKYGRRSVKICSEPYIAEDELRMIEKKGKSEARIRPKKMSERENPFKRRIFVADTGRSMTLRTNEGFVDKKFYGCGREMRCAHSIPFESVARQVKEQLTAEKRQAEYAAKMILSGEEGEFERVKAKLSAEMRCVTEKMALLLAGNLKNEELSHLDAQAGEISEKFKTLETAFSLKNPWISLFRHAEIGEEIDTKTFRNLAERVVVSEDYKSVTVEIKARDMKMFLPEKWHTDAEEG